MTGQIRDPVSYEDRRYSLAGVNGEGLFEPASLGLEDPMEILSWSDSEKLSRSSGGRASCRIPRDQRVAR